MDPHSFRRRSALSPFNGHHLHTKRHDSTPSRSHIYVLFVTFLHHPSHTSTTARTSFYTAKVILFPLTSKRKVTKFTHFLHGGHPLHTSRLHTSPFAHQISAPILSLDSSKTSPIPSSRLLTTCLSSSILLYSSHFLAHPSHPFDFTLLLLSILLLFSPLVSPHLHLSTYVVSVFV